MIDENTQAETSQSAPQDDIDTTPTQGDEAASAAPRKWTMPEPVFRQTSGKLQSGFPKVYGAPDRTGSADGTGSSATDHAPLDGDRPPDEEPKAAAEAPQQAPAMPAIEPQPDLSEELDLADIVPPIAIEKGRPSGGLGKVALVLVVLVLLAVLAVAFAAIVWFLLLPAAENTVG